MSGADKDIRALLFDKDGTLFGFQQTWAPWAMMVLQRLAVGDAAVQQALADAIDYDLQQHVFRPSSPVIAGTADEAAALLAPHAPGHSLATIDRVLKDAAGDLAPVPAVPLRRCLSDLRARGLKLGVATNDYESVARTHVAEVLDLFDFVAGFDSGHGAKPQPGMLLAFAKSVGMAPHHCAMVGDSRHDLLAGRAAGMHTIGVLTGTATAQDLADLADTVLKDIGEIAGFLDR